MEESTHIVQLENQIRSQLGLDADHVIFSYKLVEGITQLDVLTYNPRHQQSFLLHTTRAINKPEALEKMLNYLETHLQRESSYTIQWMKVGDNTLHTSYFRARTIYDVLDKFYYDRDMNSYKVYSISLNPIS